MNENDSLAGGDVIPVNVLFFLQFTVKKMENFQL
ncbi:hypothetical protein NGUA32_00005 [Salmonella enterica]|nr:hypothetical protein NGUA32_00005 [Salmonella enterica]